MRVRVLPIVAGLVLLAGCGESVNDDRADTAGGNRPDAWGNVTFVTAYHNVDGAPTVVLFCTDRLRFAATLSLNGTTSPALLRLPEQDRICGGDQ